MLTKVNLNKDYCPRSEILLGLFCRSYSSSLDTSITNHFKPTIMKQSKLLFTITMFFLAISLSAQVSFGIKAGASMSTTYGSPESINGTDIESIALRPGYQFGLRLGLDLNDRMQLLGEINFDQRNGMKKINIGQSIPTPLGDVLVDVEADLENRFNYLNVPVLFAYGNQQIKVYAGPSVAYLLSATSERTTSTMVTRPAELPANTPGLPQSGVVVTETDFINDAPFKDNGSFINRVDIGANLGFIYQLEDRVAFDFRIYHGITDATNDDYDVSLITQTPRSDNDRNVSLQLSMTYLLWK